MRCGTVEPPMGQQQKWCWSSALFLFFLCACGTNNSSVTRPPAKDSGTTLAPAEDGGIIVVPPKDGGSSKDPLHNDPFPSYCGPPDGGWTSPPTPTGTADCPSDKNLEGCPCTNPGEQASCWPGKRLNRNRGNCRDGTTTCGSSNEFDLTWGACQGAILPSPQATAGAGACTCFSRGAWKLANTTPCFIGSNGQYSSAVSTYMNGAGKASCPSSPPSPQPGTTFSANTLRVDCEGQFELCYTLKAGDYANPKPTDCVMAKVCTSGWYGQHDVEKAFPDLPAWTSSDTACVQQFATQAGYGEMSVKGKSMFCEDISDGGTPLVFQRVKYCPLSCNSDPSRPECAQCGNGASGDF